ncbi:MAG: tRNA (adenosine(37)-N6)-threonylcarbamoyltransferase complex dimerization subunit type 1 TsaB [Phycisphaerae bacterium]|nr:MAG: tRNA (adenosine(37)-N6)-threonylcarbamoyltransferase complex dimerization subunit type 1 TsaB [Planctomycetota bacterium]KAB2938113.1 MAG: tRNA (adenosine(37)-N6)-threonylcarbamoyltransferase complex dimerization subunit type 1 TsaB [Phycisphaerae bacterium]MBE7455588.1 tRNA (adenosine(37)-N6)-threonylcarbamoyltransferase complex dimerization subunit type 1 TsaB [Planctomycetia bacterium]MCK6463225.1 tRNA (adenosine(37)-N6)-threonylcarbamoyltransferase complex dimerization subunit type 1
MTQGKSGFELAIETSGRHGSVAVGREGRVLASKSFVATLNHATQLVPAIDEIVRAAGAAPDALHFVYVSGGPGSFTGLRVGVATARMLALAVGAKLVRVPTFEVIARNALRADPPPARVVVMSDAKRGHVYAATFALVGDEYHEVSPAVEADAAEYLSAHGAAVGTAVIGDGVTEPLARARLENFRMLPPDFARPEAAEVLALGHARARQNRFDEPGNLIPIYVRRPEAEERWEARNPDKQPARQDERPGG